LITRIIFWEEYRSLSCSLCIFLPLHYYLVPLRPKYSTQHPISTTSAYVSPPVWATKLQTHTKQKAKLELCIS
jgi:hypothetical protein